MRIVTWNCNMAAHAKLTPLLALKPEVKDCQRAGLKSGFLAWRLCVVFDLEHEVAFKYGQQALQEDPAPFAVQGATA